MAFKKGQSGNPGGRPKGMDDVEQAARAHTVAAIRTLSSISENEATHPSARVAAANALLDRAWGKPRQSVEHSGDKDNPIQHAIEVRFVKAKGE